MNDLRSTMAVLQFGDSFFPSGSVSFSWGLEALVGTGSVSDAASLESFVIGQLHARWAGFDRAVVAAAHRAGADLDAVAAIDDLVEVQTPSAELRAGSKRMGDAMLSVFARLACAEAGSYRALIRSGSAHGHVAAMQGMLWARAGLSEADAIALSAHTFCIGLLGAGIRLGCLTHIEAQQTLIAARHEAAAIADAPPPPLDEISAFAIEAEIAVMRHADHPARMFAT
jgi:urease accessory protein